MHAKDYDYRLSGIGQVLARQYPWRASRFAGLAYGQGGALVAGMDTERPEEDKPSIVARIVANNRWVFEGSHAKTNQLRVGRADILIWLDVPVALHLYRIIRRAVRGRGLVRYDMSEDCPERLDMLPGFIFFVLRSQRSGDGFLEEIS
ncbi:MAG: hypothetical protein AAFR71_00985 [Pseudomonadota bacterium]